MALACQKNSYLKQLDTVVTACISVPETGDKSCGYEIILEDTVLFPEGGGQPDDRGKINDVDVRSVQLKENKAIHMTDEPLDPGTHVTCKVDWNRRFDHMQQHSAQHLVTAVADREYNFKTLSWWLGGSICKIELNTKSVTQEQVANIETLCNEYIRDSRPMYPIYYDSVDDPKLAGIRSRGLPEGVTGPIRVMTIEGVDENMCCGTHVSNLSHLQCIKLMGVEKAKKGATNLLFLAGDRVRTALNKSLDIETKLNALLKGSPERFPDLVTKLQTSYKEASKNASNLLKEIVSFDAENLNKELETLEGPVAMFHRKEGDPDYLNSLLQKLNVPDDKFVLLTAGNERGVGCLLAKGPSDSLQTLSHKMLEIVDGKGACKTGRLQGKANKLSQKHKIVNLIVSNTTNLSAS